MHTDELPGLRTLPLTAANAAPSLPGPSCAALARRLLGDASDAVGLPPLPDLITTLLALASGHRRKSILPLSESTGELALVRRGKSVLVTHYDTAPVPQIFVRDRALPLGQLLDTCSDAAQEVGQRSGPGALRDAAFRLGQRAAEAVVKEDTQPPPVPIERRGGALVDPGDRTPLSFGFLVRVAPADGLHAESAARADVHALLFDGQLWAYVHGRKLPLARGPIFPVVQRMIHAARGIVEAWEAQRGANLRMRAGDLGIGMRLDRMGKVGLTVGGTERGSLSLPPMDVPGAVLPLLRLGSDLVRAVVSVDRLHARNLRLTGLRDEIRTLRRLVQSRSSAASFTNRDPDLLRAYAAHAPGQGELRAVDNGPEPGKLRFSLRWHAEIEGLDASSTFLCGDRIVVANPKTALALDRDEGQLLWLRDAPCSLSLMAGTALVRVDAEGEVELCDVQDGSPYARTRISPRIGGPPLGLFAGGRQVPPLAVIAEGRDRLVAVDVRTGAQCWRFRSRGRGGFRLQKAGRVLLVATGDNTLDALDVTSGEVVWRWSDRGRIVMAPAVARDVAVAVVGSPGGRSGTLLGLDLYSGQLLWKQELSSGPAAAPIASEGLVTVALSGPDRGQLAAFDAQSGEPMWQAPDPGLNEGGVAMAVDRSLVINAPSGAICALDTATGQTRWDRRTADPVRDDVPRRLEPVLRGGALFVPAASVHLVRPSDGASLGTPVAAELIPDFLRVDERGWLYVAEESGHVEAYAPVPNLRLVKS